MQYDLHSKTCTIHNKKKAPLVQQDDTTISILQKWTKIKIKL